MSEYLTLETPLNTNWEITRNGVALYEYGQLIDEELNRFFIVVDPQTNQWQVGRASMDDLFEESHSIRTMIELWLCFTPEQQAVFMPMMEQFMTVLASAKDHDEVLNFIQAMVKTFDLQLKSTQISLMEDYLFVYSGPTYQVLTSGSDELIPFQELMEQNQLPTPLEQLLMLFIIMDYIDFETLKEEIPEILEENKAALFHRLFHPLPEQC